MIEWQSAGQDYADIVYETAEGIAKITINRPEVRNAFRPATLFELSAAFTAARDDPSIGVIILTGAGTQAFCSGGDQKVRGDDGYVDAGGVGRLNVLDLQVQIRRTPKPVVAMVAGYAVGGGHVLHVCCDLTIAADNARFGQTGPRGGGRPGRGQRRHAVRGLDGRRRERGEQGRQPVPRQPRVEREDGRAGAVQRRRQRLEQPAPGLGRPEQDRVQGPGCHGRKVNPGRSGRDREGSA